MYSVGHFWAEVKRMGSAVRASPRLRISVSGGGSGAEDLYRRERRSDPCRISGQQRERGHSGVCPDEEIGKRLRPDSPASSVDEKCLPCEEKRLVGDREVFQLKSGHCGAQILDSAKPDRYFGKDDVVDTELMIRGPSRQGSYRPFRPLRVIGEDVQQH